MARIKATEQPKADELTIETESPFTDADALEPFLERLGAELGVEKMDSVFIHVWMIEADNTRAKLGKWRPDDFSMDQISRTYGSGKYEIRMYAEGAMRAQQNVTIKLSPSDEAKVQAAIAAAKNPELARAAQDNNSGLANVMAEGFMRLGELITRAAQPPQVDQMAQIEKLAGVVKAMMPAAPVATVERQPSFMEMLNMIKTFNDVTGANKTPIPEGADASTAILMKAMDSFGPLLSKAAEAKAAQTAAPTQPASAPALAAPTAEPQQDEGEDMMLFKLQLKAACKKAAKGEDAAAFAESVYSMLPDEVLTGMGTDPQWFVYLTNAVPECAQYAEWFSAVRAALVDMAVEDELLVRQSDGSLTLPIDPAQDAANNTAQGKPADAANAG